ncbi:MAG: hypothetical protein WDO69_09875 [Pseudomonadota bacterium]
MLIAARLRASLLMLMLVLGAIPYGCSAPSREFGSASAGVSSANAGASAGSDITTSGGVNGGERGGNSTAGEASGSAGSAGAAPSGGAAGTAEAGAGGSTAFTPPPMDGLALWLVADDGPELYGHTITKWHDRSANGLVLQQTVTSRQPTLLDNALAGRRVVYFDGDDDGFDVPSGFDFSQGLSIFVMLRMDTVPENDRCAEIFELMGTPDHFMFFVAFAYFRYEANNHANAVNGPALAPGVPHFISVIHSPAGTNGPAQATLRQDGSVYEDGANSFPLPDGIHFTNALAGDVDSYCDQFHGYIAELLVYNRAVSYEEEMAINSRMQKQWQCCGQAVDAPP